MGSILFLAYPCEGSLWGDLLESSVKMWLLQGFSESGLCFSTAPVAEGQVVLKGEGNGSQAQLLRRAERLDFSPLRHGNGAEKKGTEINSLKC